MSNYKLSVSQKFKSWAMYKVNRKHKDRLFCLIFGNEKYKDKAVSLYNALNSSNYPANELEIYSIDDFIYISHKNDVAYLIRSTLPLYEHQSTINPNMPIRGLIYYGELYSKYIALNDLKIFGRKQVFLPTPQYIVFYNGEDEAPPVKDLHLSDAFSKELLIPGYEWTARVINLNSEENGLLLDACKPLHDYCIFNSKVRKYIKTMTQKEAINRAVNECIEEGILDDILLAHKAEILKMIFTENQEKRYLRHVREEVREETAAQFMEVIAEKDTVIAVKDAVIAERDTVIAEKDVLIAELKAQLEAAKKQEQP